MYNTKSLRSISATANREMSPITNSDGRRLLDLGSQHGWHFAVLGQAPRPTEPVRLGDWLIVPVEQDYSKIPARALERVQTIFAAGLRPEGFVMVHEAPMYLPAPAREASEQSEWPLPQSTLKSALSPVMRVIGPLSIGVGAIAGTAVFAVIALLLGAILLIPIVLLAGATGLDPILITITEDGYWIEVDRWVEEELENGHLAG